MNDVTLFTHGDLDGVGCAVLATIAFGDNLTDIHFCNYDNVNDIVERCFRYWDNYGLEFHITDISIQKDLASDIDRSDDIFYLFDHHPTAMHLSDFPWCTVKIEDERTKLKTCGTEIYYKWLVKKRYLYPSDALKRFVEIVRDYDTWRWASMGEEGRICKKVNDLMYLYGKNEFIVWCVEAIYEGMFPIFSAQDEFILHMKQKEIDAYINQKEKGMVCGDLLGHPTGFIFANRCTSELGNTIATRHPELDLIAIINMDHGVEYRSVKEDIDLGKDIAAVFGGGGHPKAAGSSISPELKQKIIDVVFRKDDMILNGASKEDLSKTIKHSMAIIDEERCKNKKKEEVKNSGKDL